MRYLKTNRISCFSPPVMIATFVIEIALAVYVSYRYKLNAVSRLAIAILFCLALFQLAEWNVCEGSFGIDSLSWSRLGYVAITMLPPLGLHLATRLAGEKRNGMIASAYTAAGLFAVFFAFSGHGIVSQACLGNYVIFQSAPGAMLLYGTYYHGWLILGVSYCLYMARRQAERNRALALRALAAGYLSFMLPTAIANLLDPATLAGIPSIMCGFAVMLAIILSGEVLPAYFHQPTMSSFFAVAGQGIRGKATK